MPDWIEAHNRTLAAIGGVPALLVPDNARPQLERLSTGLNREGIPIARLQQWNPERYDNGTIEDWKITVFSEPFEEFSKT